MRFFSIQNAYCWGTLNLLKWDHYKDFCATTYVLYKEFIEDFPEFKNKFPEKYNLEMAKHKLDNNTFSKIYNS